MDHRCKCCGPDETPAEDCPPGPPCATRTVTISFSISPRSCLPIEAVAPYACDAFCPGGKVKGCDCSQVTDLFVPGITYGSGYADASFWVVWHTHYTTAGSPCVGTLVPCGSASHDFTTVLSGTVTATVSCAPGCTTVYAYYPSEAAWNDPEQDALRFTIDASWCEECECDALAPWCAVITIHAEARWFQSISAPTFGYAGPVYLCDCGDDSDLALDYPAGTETVGVGHLQILDAQFERRILASQTQCGPAPGNYLCKSASWQNQPMVALAPGLIWYSGACTLADGLYYDALDSGGIGLCDPDTATCGKGSMADAGWNLTVEVA